MVLMCVLLGCGSDLPRDTGVGTISGRISYSGKYYSDGKIIGLGSPWLMIVASFMPINDPKYMFQSALMVPCSEFPETGFTYELKGLYPSDYYVYGEIADFANENWLAPFSFGGYKSWLDLEKVEVTSTAAVVDIDLTLLDVQ
jgi:hypothetical protein